VSGQDDLNPTLWLATRTGKMALPSSLGTTAVSRKRRVNSFPYTESSIDDEWSIKKAEYNGIVYFLPKKQILTSRLVNNPYVFALQQDVI